MRYSILYYVSSSLGHLSLQVELKSTQLITLSTRSIYSKMIITAFIASYLACLPVSVQSHLAFLKMIMDLLHEAATGAPREPVD